MKLRQSYLIIAVLTVIAVHMLLFEQGLGGDGWGYYATCESVLIDGDLNLDNNIYGVYNGFTQDPQTGRYITQYPPGLALMNAPFFLIGNIIGSICPVDIPQEKIFNNPNFKDLPNNVFFRIFGFVFAHNIYAMLGLFILYLTLLINGFSTRLSAIAVLLTYFASPLHYYAQSGMSHANSFFLVACILYCFSKYLITRKSYLWLMIGIFSGLATAVRYTNGILLLVSFAFIIITADKEKLRSVAYLIAGFTAIFWILPVFWWIHANQMRPGYTGQFFFNRIPFYSILFTPRSGFFIFHPLFILSIPGFFMFLRHKKPAYSHTTRLTAVYSTSLLIPICLIYGYWGEWYGGDSYSQRYIINCLPLFTFCMVSMFASEYRWKTVAVVFAVSATIFSYTAFLISISRILQFPEGYIWPQYIWEYFYIFTQDITFSDFINGLRQNTLTLKAIDMCF
ncbi:MAG: glycosyltransferase family 39 protein [Candidatus Auribacterota bacterium]|jgi:4-amino-4-deoxy-L-arabinose transferase-like glycosyltransferase|nr:glycosyltransferase family 39 protein [Candidatus Auribacterota bacterium]